MCIKSNAIISVFTAEYFIFAIFLLLVSFCQENMRGQRGTLRALAVICHSH